VQAAAADSPPPAVAPCSSVAKDMDRKQPELRSKPGPKDKGPELSFGPLGLAIDDQAPGTGSGTPPHLWSVVFA